MHPTLNPNVHMIQVREDGLVGSFYQPGTPPPWPAAIVVGARRPASSAFQG